MSNTRHSVFWMAVYLAIVAGICALLYLPLKTAFLANWGFNALIFGVLLVGIGINFRQVLVLNIEIRWIKVFRTGETGRQTCDLYEVDIFIYFNPFDMDIQYFNTSLKIRFIYQNLSVKTSRTKQCRIEYFRTVCRGQDDDRHIGTEAVHLGKQLVERLFTFIITAHHTAGRTTFTDRIDLIDKDDRRGIFLSLLK